MKDTVITVSPFTLATFNDFRKKRFSSRISKRDPQHGISRTHCCAKKHQRVGDAKVPGPHFTATVREEGFSRIEGTGVILVD